MSNLVFPLALAGAIVDSSEASGDVQIDTSANGSEVRSAYQTTPRYRYKVTQALLRAGISPYERQELASFYARHRGQLDTFLVLDADDNEVTDHGFGVGDGASFQFQLQRSMLGGIRDTLGGPWGVSSKPRHNYLTHSQKFDDAAWTATGVTVSQETGMLGPDGTYSLYRLDTDGSTGEHRVAQTGAISADVRCLSVFVQADDASQIFLRFGTALAVFDAVSGAVLASLGSPQSVGAVKTPAGTRCWIAVAPASTVVNIGVCSSGATSWTGDGSGLWLWGAQVDVGAAPTPYISTVAAAVTVNPAYWPAYADGFEPVTEPSLVGGPQIYDNGTLLTLGVDYDLHARGVVEFLSPVLAGHVLSWTGSYFRRCRFATPALAFSRIVNGVSRAEIELVSVL